MNDVIIHRVSKEELKSSLIAMLEEAKGYGWLEGLRKNHILIKPNLCYFASPDFGITTDSLLVEYLIECLRKINPDSKISLIESDGSDRKLDDVIGRLGYTELAKKLDFEIINLTREKQVEIKPNELPFTLSIPELFFEDFFFISVALLKTHHYQKITCILKNQFGCLPTPRKRELHPYLEEVIYVINKILTPDLCIVDGRVGLEGMGPVTGNPKPMGLLIAGRSPLVTDIACSQVMGFNPKSVPAIAHFLKRDKVKMPELNIAPDIISRFSSISLPEYYLLRSKIKVTRLTNKAERLIKDSLTLPYKIMGAIPDGVIKRRLIKALSSSLKVR